MKRMRAALPAVVIAAALAVTACGTTPRSAPSPAAAHPAASRSPAPAAPPSPPSPTPSPTPKPSPTPSVLLSLSGSGIGNSAPFPVTESSLTVTYTYNCASFGGSGNFIADLLSGNPSSLNSDDQSIANVLGAGGSATTTIYPQDAGSDYHLSVNSECSWSVTVKS